MSATQTSLGTSPGAGTGDTLPAMPNYEFNEEENHVFSSLARRMRFVGLIVTAIGGFSMVAGLSTQISVSQLIAAVVYLLIGIFTVSAATSFRKVVQTQGSDISHLMEALRSLRKVYAILYWGCLIGLASLMAALVFSYRSGGMPGSP